MNGLVRFSFFCSSCNAPQWWCLRRPETSVDAQHFAEQLRDLKCYRCGAHALVPTPLEDEREPGKTPPG